jgi:hypothetical protein
MIVTSGPFIEMAVCNETGNRVLTGGEIVSNRLKLQIQCLSTREFGALHRLIVYKGDTGAAEEVILSDVREFTTAHEHLFETEVLSKAPLSYLRAELYSTFGKCLSNPVWIKSKSA